MWQVGVGGRGSCECVRGGLWRGRPASQRNNQVRTPGRRNLRIIRSRERRQDPDWTTRNGATTPPPTRCDHCTRGLLRKHPRLSAFECRSACLVAHPRTKATAMTTSLGAKTIGNWTSNNPGVLWSETKRSGQTLSFPESRSSLAHRPRSNNW